MLKRGPGIEPSETATVQRLQDSVSVGAQVAPSAIAAGQNAPHILYHLVYYSTLTIHTAHSTHKHVTKRPDCCVSLAVSSLVYTLIHVHVSNLMMNQVRLRWEVLCSTASRELT